MYCNRSCLWVCDSPRAGGVRTLLLPAHAQVCVSLSAFFITVSIETIRSICHGRCDGRFFVLENFHRKFANHVAPLTNGTAKRLVSCEEYLVPGHGKLRCNRNSIGDAIVPHIATKLSQICGWEAGVSLWRRLSPQRSRSSADADNGLDAFVGQSRSTNILGPFQVK